MGDAGLGLAGRRTPDPRFRNLRYGEMGCGGITLTHWLGGVRSGLPGTCVGSPLASVSSAAREQFPAGMFHQLDVMGYAAVYETGSGGPVQFFKLFPLRGGAKPL